MAVQHCLDNPPKKVLDIVGSCDVQQTGCRTLISGGDSAPLCWPTFNRGKMLRQPDFT